MLLRTTDMIDFILILSLGILIGAVAVPLFPPLFRAAEWVRSRLRLGPHAD